MSTVQHHQHVRKRLYKNLEKFPHSNPAIRFLDTVMYVVGICGPLATIPQVYLIYAYKNATGVSLFFWSMNFTFAVIWFVYGLVHKEKILILTYGLWILMNGLVVTGIILYS